MSYEAISFYYEIIRKKKFKTYKLTKDFEIIIKVFLLPFSLSRSLALSLLLFLKVNITKLLLTLKYFLYSLN